MENNEELQASLKTKPHSQLEANNESCIANQCSQRVKEKDERRIRETNKEIASTCSRKRERYSHQDEYEQLFQTDRKLLRTKRAAILEAHQMLHLTERKRKMKALLILTRD